MSSEPEIIRSAIKGNSASFRQLVHSHQGRLFRAMVQVTGSAEEAEDVVQEAFVRAFLKLHTFQQNSQFFTWLFRIAFNLVLSQRRSRRVDFSVEAMREQNGAEPVDPGESPESRLVRNEKVAFIQEALQHLSENHRAILILREMDDCSYEQISAVLEISIGTVRSRLSRARTQLRLVVDQMHREQVV